MASGLTAWNMDNIKKHLFSHDTPKHVPKNEVTLV